MACILQRAEIVSVRPEIGIVVVLVVWRVGAGGKRQGEGYDETG
jgi:hypothetical protein